jgi:alpha-glucosidase
MTSPSTKSTRHRLLTGAWLVCSVVLFNLGLSTVLAADPELITLKSPSGDLTLDVSVKPKSNFVYAIRFKGKPVILNSAISIELADGTTLGQQAIITKIAGSEVSDRFRHSPGKRLIVDDHYKELVLDLVEADPKKRHWQFVARAYDDGLAFRYRFPKQANWSQLQLAKEKTQFSLPSGSNLTYLSLPGFVTSHEGLYARKSVEKLPIDQVVDIPLLVETPDQLWIAITEANLTNYAGMFLKRRGNGSALVSQLSPQTNDLNLSVKTSLPAESPWRVIQVSDVANSLLESDLVLKLNEPSKISDPSWICPGKTTFPWWNGYYEKDLPFKPGLNTAFAKHYIDFCAEYGIPYHSLDGIGNTAWYGGPIVPYEGDDPTTPVEGLDLREVLNYAKAKGVRLRVWLHWQAAQTHMHRAFPIYRKCGIEGVMIDFMDRNDQEMVLFQRELLQLAADNQLTVTFHGAAPPSGLERTYPNLLNTEAVMNLEYDKWNKDGVPSEHDVTVPFTRMLAGPLDYHQGSFRTVSKEDFKPQDMAPVVIGTPCRTLASYVVFQNHLPMLADYPTAYRQSELTQVAAQIPATCDETTAIAGEVGEFIAIARRARDEWYVGVMTDSKAREIEIPLKFLDGGMYVAEIYEDRLDAPQKFLRRMEAVTSQGKLKLSLAQSGGGFVRLAPAPTTPPGWRLVWSDDFKTLNSSRWHTDTKLLADEQLQVVPDPKFASIKNGTLLLQCDKADPKQVGRAVSVFAQRFGRWEVRARLPKSHGIHSFLRLLPDSPWPTGGEIDIMTNNGQPLITNSEFHWGADKPTSHNSRVIPQRASVGGKLEDFSDGFHTYAVEWTPNQLRFYVDDVYHTVFYSDEVGDFLPKLVSPMHLVIETRLSEAGETSENLSSRSSELLVDWVRVYEADINSASRQLVNGGFEKSGGSLSGWHVFGNQMTEEPNVFPTWEQSRTGQWSLAMSGPSNGGESYSGISQGINVVPGQLVKAKVWCKVDPKQKLSNTDCFATIKVEFYKRAGDYFGGPGMISFKEIVIADHNSVSDEWQPFEMALVAAEGAVEARLSLVFAQKNSSAGRVFIDEVEFVAQDN